MRNILLVISGPSGVGKGTLVNGLLHCKDEFALSVSCTTRAPRTGEREGTSYFFLPRQTFEEMIARGEFLEYDEHFGNLYGTPRSFVEEKLKNRSVLLEIDVVGALHVKESYPEAVLVMVCPPDRETLAGRLRGRSTESEEELLRRLARADYELSQSEKFDHVLINDDLQDALRRLEAIITEEKNRN